MKKTSSRFLPTFLFALFALVSAFSAYAQEAAPGDACAAGENGRYALTGGPELSNTGHLIICNGSNWIKVMSFTTDGVTQLQFTNTGSCSDGEALTYNAATGGLTCGVTDIIDPIWVTSAGTITTTNVNLAISEVVAASDESGTPTYQKVSGAGWLNVATNGTISGSAPAGGGTYSVVVRATDGSGNTADRTFDVVVNGGSGPVGCVNPGDICPDLTLYAGLSPDGDVNMFTTQADLGAFAFNDGTNNWLDSTITNCTNVQSTCRTGEANTNAMILADSATTTAGIDPHNAALACFCFGEEHTNRPNTVVPPECSGDPLGTNSMDGFGYDDWYLPSIAELDVMYVNLVSPGDTDNPTYQDGINYGDGGGVNAANDGPAAGSFGTNWYRSSSERYDEEAWVLNTGAGQIQDSKDYPDRVRCIRK